MNLIRRLLVIILTPILRRIAARQATRQTLRLQAARDIIRAANIGDVVLTRRRGSLTGFLIPGFWSHAALVVGDDRLVHATYPRVQSTTITELVLSVSDVLLIRTRFTSGQQRAAAVTWAQRQLGLPYDLGFTHGVDAFYCSELVWSAYSAAVPGWRFNARKRLGVETVTPQDLSQASEDFEHISRRSEG